MDTPRSPHRAEAPDAPTNPFSAEAPADLATRAYPELDKARVRSVRLIVSIPVLFLLVVLGSGASLYVYLMNLSHAPTLTPAAADSLESAALLILLLSIFISLIASVVGYILARQIVIPIRQLTQTMDSIAEGNFSSRVSAPPLGEIGQLGSSFNRMVEQLNSLFEERDRQLRESFGGAHLLVDRSGLVLSADEAVRRILGIAPVAIIYRNLLDPSSEIGLIARNPRLLAALAELIQKAAHGQPISKPILVRGTNPGDPTRLLLSAVQLEFEDPRQERILLEMRDVSGIYNFYEQIQRADRLAAIGTLATGIAHEIRNPLASIRGMVQLMAETAAENPETDRHPGYHARILREVDRLEKLITDIMDFAHAGDSAPEEVNLNQLLFEACEAARYKLGEVRACVDLRLCLDEDLPTTILMADRVRQAILNLVLNAFEHAASIGRGPVRVTSQVDTADTNRPILLTIANPGEPLDDITRERIFEPFYTSKPEGTGLGVPIAYQTILANRGTLELQCEEGEIRFLVRFPRDMQGSRSASRIVPRFHTPPPMA
jgi:nitrogen fixation/metabolism regulation signal transduction histidine kinase